MGADPEEEEEEEAVATSEEEQEEDVSEDDEGEDEEAGPSGRDSDAPDALPSDVDETENEEDEEYQEDETDEEMFDETHTVDDVLRSVNDERADGPAPYEILAQRKREANEKNEAAFRAELRSLGVNEREVEGLEGFGGKDKGKGGKGGARGGGGGKNAGKGRNRYRASELLERHNIDKEEVIKKNPAFAAFLGAAKQAGAVGNLARGDGPGRGRPKNPRRTRRRVVLDEAAQKLGEANSLYARGPEEWPRAMELLLEVIRLAPNDPDPYHTMAMIHDETAEGHREKARELVDSARVPPGGIEPEHERGEQEEEAEDVLRASLDAAEEEAALQLSLAARYEKKALDYSMIGATLRPRDVDTWYKLAQKSRANKNPRAALFCYGEALKNDPRPYARVDGRGLSNHWAQAEIFLEIREPRRALDHLVDVRDREPGNPRVATLLAQVYAELGDFETAEKTLDDFVAKTPGEVDLTLVNVHAESKMHAHAFAEAVALIDATRDAVVKSERERAKRERVNRAEEARLDARERALEAGEPPERAERLGHDAAAASVQASLDAQRRDPPFPPDLVAKAAMCALYLNELKDAREKLAELQSADPATYHDLWYECGVVCQDVREFEQAELLFTRLIHEVPDAYDASEVWERVGECVKARVRGSSRDAAYAAAASETAALEFWRSVARRHPHDVDATLPLAEALLKKGAQGREILDALPDEKTLLRAMTAAKTATSSSLPDDRDATVVGGTPLLKKTMKNAQVSDLERVRFRAARALALRRRVGGDDAFLREAVALIDSMRARGVADAVAARKRKRAAREAALAKRSKSARHDSAAVPKSDGVFVGYQKRDRSKPKPARDADRGSEDGEDGLSSDAEETATTRAPITLAVPFELTLSAAHALFLRGDKTGASRLLDEILQHSARESGLEKNQQASFLYLKAHVASAGGDFRAAAEAAKLLCERVPKSMEAWSLHLAAAERAEGRTASTVFLRACVRSDREERAREARETAEDEETEKTEKETDSRRMPTSPTLTNDVSATKSDLRGGSKARAPALLASGLAHCARGAWGRAANAFARCFLIAPDEPIVCLCAAVAAAHLATESDELDDETENETERCAAAVKAAAFFQRARHLRALCSPTSAGEQEGDYNLARGLHQMGLPHLAVPLYEKVLDRQKHADVPVSASLAFEAAHNLALIYKNAGAAALARDVLRTHATV